MSARDQAGAVLAAIAPDWRVYDAGEYPQGSAYRQAGAFFCGITSDHQGRIYVGQGPDIAAATRRAVKIAKGDWS